MSSLIRAAREYAETFRAEAFVTQTLETTLDTWPDKPFISLPKPPLQSVESIKYRDKDGAEIIFPQTSYIVDPDWYMGRICLVSGCTWPTAQLYPASAIRIRFTAGYFPQGELPEIDYAANVPQFIKLAMLLDIQLNYDSISPEQQKKIIGIRDSLLNLGRVIV